MASLLFLPDPTQLAVVDIEVDEGTKTVTATVVTTTGEAPCPLCQHTASRIHSRYVRTLADLPCAGRGVRWLIEVRRFWCKNEECPRRIFTERLPACAPPYARRTLQQTATLCELAFALGGKAGERIVQLLGMPVSHDTLLRLMSRSGAVERPTPRVLGVDDFAWKKGDRYGTLLIDHELHAVVDVLPDREAETLTKWLEEHPGVEVINRDRAGTYAEGARKGAPQAVQTADRFHLLLNLQEHMTHFFERKHESLKQIAAQARLSVSAPSDAKPSEAAQDASALSHQEKPESRADEKPLTATTARQLARRAKRVSRYEEVMKLYREGASQSAIAALMGLHRDTVHRYVTAPVFPEVAHRKRGSKLDPYKQYLQQRWEEGQRNVKQLIEEIKGKGYRGGESIVYEHFQKSQPPAQWMEAYQQCKQQKAQGKQVTPLSARQAAWLYVCNPRKLKFRQVWALEPLRLHDEELGHAYQLVQDFRTMITQRKVELLEPWLKEVRESQIPELCSLVNGILRDYDAVRAALSTHYSNGQTEAQVHRLKLIKRQAYGRASFEQLRLRVLHGSGVTYQEQMLQKQRNQQKCV